MLELVELTGFGDHHPWQLSGGMQQRVSIARALAFEPALLLMDEPFGALDEMTRERLNLELLSIWQQLGSTVVFVTHSISEAVFLSTRVVVMSPRPGRIAGIVAIDLPYPRTVETREDPRFFELVTEVRELLRSGGEQLLPEEEAAVLGVDRWMGTRARSRPDPGYRRRAARHVADWIPAVVVLVAALVVWQGAIAAVPRPAVPAAEADRHRDRVLGQPRHALASAGWYTFKEALGGFVGGSVARDPVRGCSSRASGSSAPR